MCCQLYEHLLTDVEATFFSLEVIVKVLGRIHIQAPVRTRMIPQIYPDNVGKQILSFHFIEALHFKTKEQVTLRAITGTEDLIYTCSWPVLQPLLIVLSFLCSLKCGKHVCSADCWHVPTARVSVHCRTFWCVMLKPHGLCD